MIPKTHLPKYSKQVPQLNLSSSLSWLKLILRPLILISIPFVLLSSCKSYGHNSFFKPKDSIPTEPVWYPIDIAKKGSKLDVIVEVKKESNYNFYLYFYYDLPKYNRNKKIFSKYDLQTCNFYCRVGPYFLEPVNEKPFNAEESKKSLEFGKLLLGSNKFVNGKIVVTGKIFTPVRLKLFSIDLDGSQKLILDKKSGISNDYYDVEFPILFRSVAAWGYYKELIGYKNLKPGNYKIIIETLKDIPEFKKAKTEFVFEEFPKKQ